MSDTDTTDLTTNDVESVDRSIASGESWPFAIASDVTDDPVAAWATVKAAYLAAADPPVEVRDLLDAVVVPALLSTTPGARYIVRVGGRATEGHACLEGPDELLSVSISVLDPAPPEPDDEAETVKPVSIEGGSFTLVE